MYDSMGTLGVSFATTTVEALETGWLLAGELSQMEATPRGTWRHDNDKHEATDLTPLPL